MAQSIRGTRATRLIPIVFVGGQPDKVEKTRQFIPDATFTTWGRIGTALPRAIAKPPANPVVPDHHNWGRPTVAKLGVKPGSKVVLVSSPRGFADTLKPWPAKVTLTARPEKDADIYICFAKSEPELQAHLLSVRDAGRQTLWLAWPKKASGLKTELNGNIVRGTGLHAGWVDFKVCALDATWSGLAFRKRK